MSARSANRLIRNGGDRNVQDYSGLGNRVIDIGLPDDITHPDAGVTMAQLGAVHEFGAPENSPPIPQRSFLRAWIQASRSRIIRTLNINAENISVGLSIEDGAGQVALWGQGQVQEYITDLYDPPNAPLTIALKGDDNPLIDTGAMRQAVIGLVNDND